MKVEYKSLEIETDNEDKTVKLSIGSGSYTSDSLIIPAVQIDIVVGLLEQAKLELFAQDKPGYPVNSKGEIEEVFADDKNNHKNG